MQARFISLKKRPETDQTPVPFMRPILHTSLSCTHGPVQFLPCPQSPPYAHQYQLLSQHSFSRFPYERTKSFLSELYSSNCSRHLELIGHLRFWTNTVDRPPAASYGFFSWEL